MMPPLSFIKEAAKVFLDLADFIEIICSSFCQNESTWSGEASKDVYALDAKQPKFDVIDTTCGKILLIINFTNDCLTSLRQNC